MKLYSDSVTMVPRIGNYSATLFRPEWPLLPAALTLHSTKVVEDHTSLLISASKSDNLAEP